MGEIVLYVSYEEGTVSPGPAYREDTGSEHRAASTNWSRSNVLRGVRKCQNKAEKQGEPLGEGGQLS